MTFNELYKSLVIYHKIVSHEYFLDEMQIPDLCIATKYIEYAEVAQWECTRQIMLCQLKPYLKKKNMTAQEFLPLPTDYHDNRDKTTEVDPRALEWFKKMKKEGK